MDIFATPAGHVLVVDDVEGNVRLAASILEPDGYEVSSAGDGARACARASRSQPDLIFLDVIMPTTSSQSHSTRMNSGRGGAR